MPRASANQRTFSQQTDGSDDSGLMAAVVKQVQGTLEKKRKENETKFLSTAKTELAKSAATEVGEFDDALNEMKEVFDSFVMRYAAAEDNIRTLWERLLKVHQTFSESSEKTRTAIAANEKARESGQVKAMAVSKKAVEDCSRLIATLNCDA